MQNPYERIWNIISNSIWATSDSAFVKHDAERRLSDQ